MGGLEHKMKRYNNRTTFRNNDELYEKVLEEKDRLYINQYSTPRFPPITAKMKTQLTRQKYVWKTGDTYQRLAEAFYGDAKHWWVLGWYNQKPTDALVKIGDTIIIPKPLDTILQFFGV
tara:strand:+ start:3874 stop:4230 length:357 start_codon:yes stop_codon:yes gene_type:complete